MKRRRSSMTEHAFHGVTDVSGTKCHPCVGTLNQGNQSVMRRPPIGGLSLYGLDTEPPPISMVVAKSVRPVCRRTR
jgi:hypothetical protein